MLTNSARRRYEAIDGAFGGSRTGGAHNRSNRASAISGGGGDSQQRSGLEPQPVPYDEKVDRHCVVSVVEVGSGNKSRIVCYETFREAVYVATGERIKNAPNDASQAANNKAFHSRLFATPEKNAGKTLPKPGTRSAQQVFGNGTIGSGAVLSVEYEDSGYKGNTLTIRSGSGCDRSSDRDHQLRYVGGIWNDEISSFTGSNNCYVKHYQNSGFRGSSTPTRARSDYLGFANDETSSIRWY